jgi:hypothetical protein
MDPDANNYNPDAIIDDGSCTYSSDFSDMGCQSLDEDSCNGQDCCGIEGAQFGCIPGQTNVSAGNCNCTWSPGCNACISLSTNDNLPDCDYSSMDAIDWPEGYEYEWEMEIDPQVTMTIELNVEGITDGIDASWTAYISSRNRSISYNIYEIDKACGTCVEENHYHDLEDELECDQCEDASWNMVFNTTNLSEQNLTYNTEYYCYQIIPVDGADEVVVAGSNVGCAMSTMSATTQECGECNGVNEICASCCHELPPAWGTAVPTPACWSECSVPGYIDVGSAYLSCLDDGGIFHFDRACHGDDNWEGWAECPGAYSYGDVSPFPTEHTMAVDEDDDGIWDYEDDCIGELDCCGVCNGPGTGCDDECGECGGDGSSCACDDADADGVCDDEDDCVAIEGVGQECGCNGGNFAEKECNDGIGGVYWSQFDSCWNKSDLAYCAPPGDGSDGWYCRVTNPHNWSGYSVDAFLLSVDYAWQSGDIGCGHDVSKFATEEECNEFCVATTCDGKVNNSCGNPAWGPSAYEYCHKRASELPDNYQCIMDFEAMGLGDTWGARAAVASDYSCWDGCGVPNGDDTSCRDCQGMACMQLPNSDGTTDGLLPQCDSTWPCNHQIANRTQGLLIPECMSDPYGYAAGIGHNLIKPDGTVCGQNNWSMGYYAMCSVPDCDGECIPWYNFQPSCPGGVDHTACGCDGFERGGSTDLLSMGPDESGERSCGVPPAFNSDGNWSCFETGGQFKKGGNTQVIKIGDVVRDINST